MGYDPKKHHRRSIRLSWYDYSRPGAYYITSCIRDRQCLLGNVVDGRVMLNDCGNFVEQVIRQLPHRYPNIVIDTHVVMPNHVHWIVVIRPYLPYFVESFPPYPHVPVTNRRLPKTDTYNPSRHYRGHLPEPTYSSCLPVGPIHESALPVNMTNIPVDPVNMTPDIANVPNPPMMVESRQLHRRRMLIPLITGYFHMNTSREINILRNTTGMRVWQGDYYEHVIRNIRSFYRIKRYILKNPMVWERDRNNPWRINN